MTQPPNPSAAALRKPDNYWVRIHANSWWSPAHMFLSDGEERYIVAGGAHAYYTKDMLGEIGPRLIDPEEAAERAKPAASDHEAAKAVVQEWMQKTCAEGWLVEELEDLDGLIAAALAERGRVERERCAQIIEEHKTAFKDHQSIWKRVTFTMLAAAIRNQTGD